ncbi:MAG: oxygen-dependent coproporphyrinogen oxidase [Brasilonema octagenarum HA4186-MV1]|jgi:coproporphyrinogen III oxidase|uniref:coproporphyrinogen oxidase n=2 Tax=Brasilonema TaxID=383614 RepID=A0A856M894_9CYAN|nr:MULTISPECIES: oxygen-dependent coproporphyrinogen oxidase [Brasilonema]MBW4628883.1 oxygen-dependent coproporphyrinogen oxidase [Brasilonema octagenarum HA4186-MV1]NMF65694.1 oxygen-dependent coproporphyrinogen oxidase [Brasilonema octagenarum UFV-OR1]QDL07375.1 oxygen-dependent coproporphyrinogen oxidase [Brasilonema sennae CENA114]QDL13737.1 oxygen-dependent coproporphyrinogen oxidase [Brasilonema octagenarum UFV-E1]
MVQLLENTTAKQPSISARTEKALLDMFNNVCQAVEEIDGNKLHEQHWTKDEKGQWIKGEDDNGIVYIDKALRNSNVFEKVGINYVSMRGELPPGMTFQGADIVADSGNENPSGKSTPFFATSTSVIINALNPMIPTAHVNYRYFQLGDGTQPGSWWFGGGGDLTPIYLFEEDAVHFHQVHKDACDKHNPEFYPRFKKWCDQYFYLPHRGECRGVGGIFFDNLQDYDAETLFSFVKTCSEAFIPAYIPIVEKRKDMEFTQQNKYWQHLRRGRYAEFILLHDRGVRFGLASGIVSTQSVLNCMPAEAFWNYNDEPTTDSQEATLLEVLRNPHKWV